MIGSAAQSLYTSISTLRDEILIHVQSIEEILNDRKKALGDIKKDISLKMTQRHLDGLDDSTKALLIIEEDGVEDYLKLLELVERNLPRLFQEGEGAMADTGAMSQDGEQISSSDHAGNNGSSDILL